MKIDWSQQPWWMRPALAIAWGLGIGLVGGMLLSLFSAKTGLIGVLVLCGGACGYCVWALWDLRKMRREWQQYVEQLEQLGYPPDETQRRRRRRLPWA